jgi:hypothetical protein
VLLRERLNEREDCPDVKATIRLVQVGRIGDTCADLALQSPHIVNQKMRHALQFLKPTVQIHSYAAYQRAERATLRHDRGRLVKRPDFGPEWFG